MTYHRCWISWQCVWHINSTLSSNFLTMCVTNQANCITVSSHFPTMSVTYQVNYLVKLSDNVCDISSQPYHPIFWQSVKQIRRTVLLYHLIFRQCPWHIRPTTLFNFLTMCVTNQANSVTISSHFQTMSMTYQVNYPKKCFVTCQVNLIIQFSNNVCDKSGDLYHCIIPFSDNVCDISGQLSW